tara:strand:+ start:557 stop:1261 length:705 start_codon:yes stop_codon:yes gene_type:complete
MQSYLFLILSVVAGTLIAAFLFKQKSTSVKFLLTFSGAYLLGIGVFHLLPEIYEGHNHTIGFWIMGGFFIQLVLEVFSKGMEHGHGHKEMFHAKSLPIGVLASLFLHALLESLPIGAQHDHGSKNALLWGIVIHKLPVSIILFTMMKELTSNMGKILTVMVMFALIAPLGVFVGESLPILGEYYRELTALTLGVFLHISTTILFESNQSHRFNFMKFFAAGLAVVLAWFSVAHH